ncbi:EI24 domain-containing protein [Psychrilyobacter sp.]|uniref:EI24 domain-containing protein n=1 Tax=Psychrilyobacter sp. TaxID=2586924 RepID=UPI00301A850A
MLKEINYTFNNYMKAFKFIGQNKLKKFYLIPGIINIILATLFYFLSKFVGGTLVEFANNLLGGNLNSFIQFILKFIIYLTIFAVYYLIYKTLILIILSPFLSYISERTESIITGNEFNFSFKQNLYFIKRGIVVTLKSFLREFIMTCLILLLFFIPLVNAVIPILLFMVQSYYIGFSFIDYTLERHDFQTGTDIIRKNTIFFLINGGLFTILLFIPLIGIFIAPLVTAVATTTGTLELIEQSKQEKDTE